MAPLSAVVDHTVAAAVTLSGLTAWQGACSTHGEPSSLARNCADSWRCRRRRFDSGGTREERSGPREIGSESAEDKDTVLGLGADIFVDLKRDELTDFRRGRGGLDVIGGERLVQSTKLVRAGGALVTIAENHRMIQTERRTGSVLRRQTQYGNSDLLGAQGARWPVAPQRGSGVLSDLTNSLQSIASLHALQDNRGHGAESQISPVASKIQDMSAFARSSIHVDGAWLVSPPMSQ